MRTRGILLALLMLASVIPSLVYSEFITQHSVKTLGPYLLGDDPRREVSLRLETATILEPEVQWPSTLSVYEFMNRTGKVLYRQAFPQRIEAGRGFEVEYGIGPIKRIEIGRGEYLLLVYYGYLPSAPGFNSYKLFGYSRVGDFIPFRVPLDYVSGDLKDERSDLIRLREGRYLDFHIWGGYFELLVTLRLNRENSSFEVSPPEPDTLPVVGSGNGEKPLPGVIRLYLKPDERSQHQQVKVGPESMVELIKAYVPRLRGARNGIL